MATIPAAPNHPATATPHETASQMPRFAEVIAAIEADASFSRGVRSNLLRAVHIAMGLVSAPGVEARVDIQALRVRLKRTTPAMLGFRSSASFSAFCSNLRRALRLAGVRVMPGKSRTPATGDWLVLKERAEHFGLLPALSRFLHYCSAHGVEPGAIDKAVLARFVALVKQSSLKSSGDKIERQVTIAWEKARQTVPGWPDRELPIPLRRKAECAPPWSAYPPSLEQDARAFVSRGEDDWLDPESRTQIRPCTAQNYLAALRHIAGELVALGMPAEDLKTLADLVTVDRAKRVLARVAARTGRQQGGHVSLLAVVLFLVGRDHVKLPLDQVAKLAQFEKATRPKREMSTRTLRRLEAMTPERIDALLRLPGKLVRLAKARPSVDVSGARLVRCALFLSLLLDTAARQGNVVSLRFGEEIIDGPDGSIFVVIDGALVKNGEEIRSPLRRQTADLLHFYREIYRPLHAEGSEAPWLFPRPDGSHWRQDRAYDTMMDVTAKHVGVALNPHAIRSIVGEIFEQRHPGALGAVRDILGHRSVTTTEAYYRRRGSQRSRQLFHRTLEERMGGRS
ncbi:tyrosine-type recombinase/integrase [Neoroseomonas rubea]|uniref:tyrosine-type recombinase/integrase n=1 Tax=Neoroseomonas rubea TaxID=2748666 RepID=UPI0018DF7295|nr:tyrosine-type recombinase/integrase [Roseomonas rubea]